MDKLDGENRGMDVRMVFELIFGYELYLIK